MVPATRSPTLRIAVIARAKVLPRVGTRWIAEASLRRSFYPISKTNTAFRRPVFKPKSRALNDIICPGLVLASSLIADCCPASRSWRRWQCRATRLRRWRRSRRACVGFAFWSGPPRSRIIRIERPSASKSGGDNWLSLVGLAIAGLGSRLVMWPAARRRRAHDRNTMALRSACPSVGHPGAAPSDRALGLGSGAPASGGPCCGSPAMD